MSTSKLTSSVNSEIREKYDATFEKGKAVYKEMIEEGMLKRIEEFNPIEACKLRIDRYNDLLKDETEKLEKLMEIENRRKETQNNKITELDKKRLEKFENKKEIYATQYKNDSQDWVKIAHALWLDNAKEAKDYVIPKLVDAGLLD